MGEPATRPATYEDLLQVPEHLIAEIISGGVSQVRLSAPLTT